MTKKATVIRFEDLASLRADFGGTCILTLADGSTLTIDHEVMVHLAAVYDEVR